jgi:hypothetical protein
MVAEAEPPKDALKFIGLSAGKTLPFSFLLDSSGKVLWSGQSPMTLAELNQMIQHSKIPKETVRRLKIVD